MASKKKGAAMKAASQAVAKTTAPVMEQRDDETKEDLVKRLQIHPQVVARQQEKLKRFLSRLAEPKPGPYPFPRELGYEQAAKNEAILAKLIDKSTKDNTLLTDVAAEIQMIDLKFERCYWYWQTFPINKLPEDILIMIFKTAAWSAKSPLIGSAIKLCITSVCQLWRRLAISDANLWSNLRFYGSGPWNREWLHLERSGSSPLDVRLDTTLKGWNSMNQNHPFGETEMFAIIDRLFVKLSYIRFLSVVVDTWAPALAVLTRLEESGQSGVPINLQAFELHRIGQPYVWTAPGFLKDPKVFANGIAPKLRKITLNGVHIDWCKSPLSNLKTLDIRRIALDVAPTLARFVEILEACPQLDKLTLDGAGAKMDTPLFDKVRAKPIVLSALRQLIIGDFALPYSYFMLSLFSAPNLQDITFINLVGDDYAQLIYALGARFPKIEVLSLLNVEIRIRFSNQNAYDPNREMVMKFLNEMKNLRYLRIMGKKSKSILDAFLDDSNRLDSNIPAVDRTRKIVCPEMKYLEFQDLDFEDIHRLGHLRRRLGVPLRKIYVTEFWVSHLNAMEQTALRDICELYFVPSGGITSEGQVPAVL